MISEADVQRIKLAVAKVQSEFRDKGFGLPAELLGRLESLRERESWELDYNGYLREVFGEWLNLTIPWQPSVRDRLPHQARSPYLDALASRQTPESRWLDPNYDRFLKLPHEEHMRMLGASREFKAQELARHATRVEELCGGKLSGSPATVVRRLMTSFGLSKPAQGTPKRGTWMFSEAPGTPFGMTVIFPDVIGLQKDGWLVMGQGMPDLVARPLGLHHLMLGDREYGDWNLSPQEIAFSVYARMEAFKSFQAALRDEFGSPTVAQPRPR